jgi:hypothetical protein
MMTRIQQEHTFIAYNSRYAKRRKMDQEPNDANNQNEWVPLKVRKQNILQEYNKKRTKPKEDEEPQENTVKVKSLFEQKAELLQGTT